MLEVSLRFKKNKNEIKSRPQTTQSQKRSFQQHVMISDHVVKDKKLLKTLKT